MITIPSPNTDRSLLSITELRAAAGVTDGSQDATLTLMGNYISAVITRACKVVVAEEIPPTLRLESVVETIRPRSHRPGIGNLASFSLARGPVVAVTSLVENDVTLTEGTDFELEGRIVWRISANARTWWWYGSIPEANRKIVIDYSAGWAIVPDDLKYAAIRMVRTEVQRSERDPNLKMRRIEGVSEHQWWVDPTIDTVIPPDVQDILERGDYVNRWSWMT